MDMGEGDPVSVGETDFSSWAKGFFCMGESDPLT